MAETIVITGASSGIGRLTAERLAVRGANLVLASRSVDTLLEVVQHCEMQGVEAIAHPTDVGDDASVRELAYAAVERFGNISAWINAAGITELSSFVDMPAADFEKVIQTNLFGVVNGSREALKQFTLQGYGTLINVSSVLGAVPIPYESAYVASKYAVRGFTASIRQEMLLAGELGINVCTVMPSTMSTPIYANAANRTGKEPRPIPPLYPAEMTAAAIEKLLDEPQPEVVVGKAGNLLMGLRGTWNQGMERFMAGYIKKLHFKSKTAQLSEGNLYKSSPHQGPHGNERPVPTYFDAGVMIASLLGVMLVAAKIMKRDKS